MNTAAYHRFSTRSRCTNLCISNLFHVVAHSVFPRKITWRWTTDGVYSSPSAYRVKFEGSFNSHQPRCGLEGWRKSQNISADLSLGFPSRSKSSPLIDPRITNCELILAPFLFLLHRFVTAWHTVWFVQRNRCNEARRRRGISYYFVTSNKGYVVAVSASLHWLFHAHPGFLETAEDKLMINIFDFNDFQKPKMMISYLSW